MAKMKSAAQVAEKWARVAATRVTDFEAGVKSPRRSWAQAAGAAAQTYADGVSEAISDGRYGKGVEKAGDEKWSRKTIAVGKERWAPGVRAAESDMQSAVEPYLEVIADTLDRLPPRAPRGSPQNNERQAIVSRALHEKRVGR